jgi:hypothetical protein
MTITSCTRSSDVLTLNYVNYHLACDSAENHIRSKEYGRAIEIYQRLQSGYPNMFYKDLRNLMICQLMTSDCASAIASGHALIKQGVKLEYFFMLDIESNSCYETFIQSIEKDYDCLESMYRNSTDSTFEKTLMRFMEKDQNVASRHDFVMDSVFYHQGLFVLKKLIADDYPFMINNSQSNLYITVILRHYFALENRLIDDEEQRKSEQYSKMVFLPDMENQFKDWIRRGFITPYDFIQIYYYVFNPYQNVGICLDFDNDSIFFEPALSSTKTLEEINILRQEIGLPPINNSPETFQNTWLSCLTIPKIKKAMRECTTCQEEKSYIMIRMNEQRKCQDNFMDKELSNFILRDLSIQSYQLKGFTTFIKSINPKVKINGK